MYKTRLQTSRIAAGVVLTILLAVAIRPAHAGDDAQITAAVSIVPQAWLVRQIGGDHIRIVTLVGPGESPATYQPTDHQVSEVMRADLYFRIGVPFENGAWFQAIRRTDSVHVVDLRDGITLRDMDVPDLHGDARDHEHESGKDPHIWLDPKLLAQEARTVAQALVEVDTAHADDYKANLDALLGKLDTLDKMIRGILAPHKGNAFFVFHPAWGYFCSEYGLRQIPVEIDGKEPTDSELTELQRLARKEGAKIVFVQPQITGRAAKAIADSIGGRVEVADPLAADVAANLDKMARAIADSYK